MKILKTAFAGVFLAITFTVKAMEPLDTQMTSGGLLVHLLKVTVNHEVLTVTLMFENQTTEIISIDSLNPEEIQYVAFGKRYPVLKDAEDKWMLSPYGPSKLFSHMSSLISITFRGNQKVISWMKFEAPPDEAWPIELSLPETTQFLIQKPHM